MPQFDLFSFFVQIFWLFTGSYIFYLVYLKSVLKTSAESFKLREKMKSFIVNISKEINVTYLYNTITKFTIKQI
jgi:hypothetical protein